MAALVETMFSVREKPWHGLGTIVSEAPDSQRALELAGLDWNVIQKDIITSDGSNVIPGFKANASFKIAFRNYRYSSYRNRCRFRSFKPLFAGLCRIITRP